jgi:hypothetical protein
MSSKPGNTLEEFVLWNLNLTCDDLEGSNPNPSLQIAEALGTATRRRANVTKAQLSHLIEPLEEFRESVEYGLQDFDEDTQSWRDYSGGVADRVTKEAGAEVTRRLQELGINGGW